MAGNQADDVVHYNVAAIDAVINENRASVFLHVKLYDSLFRSLNRDNAVLEIPPTHTGLLVGLIPEGIIQQLTGDGVQARVDHVEGDISFLMRVVEGVFRLSGPWRAIKAAYGLRRNASLSLWLYFDDEEAPHLIIRLDGHDLKPKQGVYLLPANLGVQPVAGEPPAPIYRGKSSRFVNAISGWLIRRWF